MNHYQRIELPRGPAGANASQGIKQAVRFARHLRERHINSVNFLSLFYDPSGMKIEVGRRVVRITNQGDFRQELVPQLTSIGWRADPQSIPAHHARMHALYLSMAASGRTMENYQSGRIMVNSARFDRMFGSAF